MESTQHGAGLPEPEQQLIFDLVRERLFELFGPGGSFRVTLGRATPGEAVFASTVADTVAWDIAAGLGTVRESPARHEQPRDPQVEHEELWAQIEGELLIRRTGPNGFMGDLSAPPAPVLEQAPVLGQATTHEAAATAEHAPLSQAARLSAARTAA